MTLPPPPLPAARIAPPLPPLTSQPTTEQLLEKMIVVMCFGATWQARRKGCKDYGPAMPTARQAMLEALK